MSGDAWAYLFVGVCCVVFGVMWWIARQGQ